MTERFEPSTAFEGYLKANMDEIFRTTEDIKKDVALVNNDVVILKEEVIKEITDLKVKVGNIKGWILAASLGFGFVGGIIGIVVSELFHLKELVLK